MSPHSSSTPGRERGASALAPVALLIAILCTAVFALKTHVISGGLYSADVNYRYQTQGFFHHSLAVRTSLMHHLHDWAWNDGAYQIWGLGVPILRMPFELLAALAGHAFPDRLVFLLLFAVTAFALATVPLRDWATRLLLIGLLLFNHTFIGLVGTTRFRVYEEAIATSSLWSVLTFALLLHAVRARDLRMPLLFGAVAGFGILIRPTGLLSGGLCLGLYVVQSALARKRLRALAWPAAAFLVGPLVNLAANYARFGSPFSFGYEISLADNAEVFYALRWGHQFETAPALGAAKELLGALFSNAWRDKWQLFTFRWRELYFNHYYGCQLFVAAAGLVAGALSFVPALRRRLRRTDLTRLAAAFSFVAFSVFFVFYMRVNGLVSRYLAEFAPSVFVGIFAFVVFVAGLARSRWGSGAALLVNCLFVGLAFGAGLSAKPATMRPQNANEAQARAKVGEWALPQPNLLDRYECPIAGDFRRGITYNGFGWLPEKKDCPTVDATMLFFDRPECLELRYIPAWGGPHKVRVRVQRDDWGAVAVSTGKDGVVTQTFCPAEPPKPVEYWYSGIKFVVIGWVEPSQIGEKDPTPRLLSVAKVARRMNP